MSETILAVDVGGTKILVGELSDEGQVLRQKKYDSVNGTQLEICECIKQVVANFLSEQTWATGIPKKMGVGLIGRVDTHEGVWLQIDGQRNQALSLARELSDRFKIDCFIDNDVKAATRAEQLWGYGKQSSNFVYLNIGTGIAAGAVVNGQLVRGGHLNAGEVGHTSSGLDLQINCVCGRKNCVERIAAGIGFDLCARMLAKQYATSLNIPDEGSGRVKVDEVYALCEQGDELCHALVENASIAIANLIMNMVRMTDPDTIVLGGGVVADGYMLSKLQTHLSKHTIRFVTNGIVLTKLDPRVIGLLGAAAVAINR